MLDPHQVQYLAQEIACSISEGLKAGAEQQPTLRDRFAMAALQGMVASGKGWPINGLNAEGDENRAKQAKAAYALADAMLLARGPKRIADSEFEEVSP